MGCFTSTPGARAVPAQTPQNSHFRQKWPKSAKSRGLPAFSLILTESPSILEKRNRRGFQSKSRFWPSLEIRGPGRTPKGCFPQIPGLRGLLLHQPLAAGPCPRPGGVLEKEGFWTRLGGEEVPGPPGGPRRSPGPQVPAAGDRAPPRGVDVKQPPRRGPGPRSGLGGSEPPP